MAKRVQRSAKDKILSLLPGKALHDRKLRETQKEVAAALGISTRTLRRLKNIPGYELAPRTVARIKAPLEKEFRNFSRFWRDRVVLVTKTRSHGVTTTKRTEGRDSRLRGLPMPVISIPIIYRSKEHRSETIQVATDLWTEAQKISFIKAAFKSGQFLAWYIKVALPVGVGYVRGEGNMPGQYVDLESSDEDTTRAATTYVMDGPYGFVKTPGNMARIDYVMKQLSDAGRSVESISLVQNLPRGKDVE